MGIIPKTAKFLGIDKFGKGLASAGRVLTGGVSKDRQNQENVDTGNEKILYALKREKDPVKKRQLQQFLQRQQFGNADTSFHNQQDFVGREPQTEQIDPGLKLTNKEVLGGAANVALNVAMPGAFKGSKAAVLGKNAVLGSAFGAASGLEKNRNASGIIGSTVGGALVGGAVGGVGLFAKAAREFIGVRTPEWIMNKAVKPALQDLKKNVKYGTKTLGRELLNEGVKGGPKKLLQIADDKLNQYEDALQSVLQAADDAFERDLLKQRMQIKALPAPSFIPLGSKTEPQGSVMRILSAKKSVGKITEDQATRGQFIKGRPLKAGRFKQVFTSEGDKVVNEVTDNSVQSSLQKNVEQKAAEAVGSYSENLGLIKKDNLRAYIKDLRLAKQQTPGMERDVVRIDEIFDSLPDQMTLLEANNIKRRIYNELRDVAYKLDPKLNTKANALKQIARGLKTEIENTVGGTVVKDINRKLSIYGRLENSMVDQLARNMRNNGVSLTDAILLAGGDTTSILALLRHIGQGVETYTAQGLSKVGEVGTGAVGRTTKNVVKRAALNAP